MDDNSRSRLTLARRFLVPANSTQRQYEALRAFFVDGVPSAEAAARFGYTPGSFRVLVHQFRNQPSRDSSFAERMYSLSLIIFADLTYFMYIYMKSSRVFPRPPLDGTTPRFPVAGWSNAMPSTFRPAHGRVDDVPLTPSIRGLTLIEVLVHQGQRPSGRKLPGLHTGQATHMTERPTGSPLLTAIAREEIKATEVDDGEERCWHLSPLSVTAGVGAKGAGCAGLTRIDIHSNTH